MQGAVGREAPFRELVVSARFQPAGATTEVMRPHL